MIISRTPFRISFFGGGTDYPSWYRKHGGSVLSATIDKYCHITCRILPPFFEHRMRLVYSRMEHCQTVDEIQHPTARETLRFLALDQGFEIHHDGDLPARSGMGSSAAFTVGLLHALYAHQGKMPSKHQLAMESIHIEQNMVKETVGSQDQMAVAHGGLNRILFGKDGHIDVRPLTLTRSRVEELNSHLMLFYTGIKRTASEVAKTYTADMHRKQKVLARMCEMVHQGVDVLSGNKDFHRFGELLHESWELKRKLGSAITNPQVDQFYARALECGALGGKITGAGGGGFLLLFVPPEKQNAVREALSELLFVPVRLEFNGSQIVFFNPEIDYSEQERDRKGRKIIASRELKSRSSGRT